MPGSFQCLSAVYHLMADNVNSKYNYRTVLFYVCTGSYIVTKWLLSVHKQNSIQMALAGMPISTHLYMLVVDAFLSFSGDIVYAHKSVLCARCEVMAAMFGGHFKEGSFGVSEVTINYDIFSNQDVMTRYEHNL